MRRYDSYKDSGFDWLGNTPTDWEVLRMCYVFRPISIKNTSGEMNLSVYRDYGVIPTNSRSDNHNVISEDTSNYKLVEKGDFVMNKMKCWMGSLGLSDYRGIVSPSYTVMKPLKNNSHKYIHYLLRSKTYIPQYKRLSYGVREGQWDLRFEDFKELPCLIPPLSEQQQIVSFLDTKTSHIDSLIEITQRKIELLKEKRTSIINEVVTKGLNPEVEMKDSGIEWIGDIPSHWELPRLNNLGDFSKGKGITKDKIKVSGHKCIRCGEIYTTYELRFNETNSFIDDETSSESVLGFKGVLLFTGDGESLEEIGKCVVYEGEEELYIGGGINVFTPKQEKVIPIYLSYVMSSESVIFQKSRQGKGEIVVHIYSKQLKEIRLGLPNLIEQQKIVEYLDEQTQLIDNTISIEEKRIELFKEYRQSLISEVVTGKRKVV